MNRARRKRERQAAAPQCVPHSLTNKCIRIVIFGVILQPVFDFPFNRKLAEIPDSYDRCNPLRNIVSITYCFAHNMDCFRRRIRVERAEKYKTGVEIITGRYFDSFSCSVAVADEHYVILKGANLDSAPCDTFDNASMFLLTYDDYIANLKGPIGV